MVTQGVIRFDLHPQKRGSKCVEMGAKKSGQEADTPALLFWLLLGCETMLLHKRAVGPLVAPAETVHPLRVCTVSAGQITSTITPAAIWPLCFFLPVLSIPFRRLCRPFLNGRGKGKDRKGMEWIIDKSLLDFIFSYLYLYFIALDFPTSVFPLSDYPTTEMPTTAKRARHHLFVPCPLSSISYRGECYRPNFKSSKQVVHLRGYLLKVQIYQPFSRAGCVLPWQTNKIFVIS